MLPASRSGKTSTLARPADRRAGRLPVRHLGHERRIGLELAVADHVGRELGEARRRLPHVRDPRTLRAPLGAVRQERDPGRVADQPGPVAGGRERDLGELLGRGLRHDGAVGEGEHRVVGEHHVERRAHQVHARRGADGPERRADRVARGTDRAGHGRVGLTQRHERRTEVDRDGGDVERVDAVHDAVRPAVAQELGDARKPRVGRRPDAAAAEQNRLGDPVAPKPLGGRAHPRVVALAEDDPLPARGRPLEQCLAEAHRWYRSASALATAGWTSPLTSPPNRATSRTRLELR